MKTIIRSGASLLMGLFMLAGVSAQAQQIQIVESVSDFRGTPEFIKFDTETPQLMSRGSDVLAEVLSFTAADELRVDRVVTDELGFTHERRQQFFQGIPVEYGTYNLHSQKGAIVMANGEFKRIPAGLAVTPTLSEDAALQNALNHVGAQEYFELPAGELVIVEDYTSEDRTPRLAFKFNVYAQAPISRDFIYVDAIDGRVIHTNAIIKHVGEHAHAGAAPAVDLYAAAPMMAPMAAGTAATRFSGTKSIDASLSGSNYRLRGTQNGVSINTYDCNTGTSYGAAVDFTDNDNNWTAAEHANAQKDDGALDAHYGAQKTIEYWATAHGRNSWNGSGAAVNSYVHYDNAYDNAFWNGSVMTYGDGSTFDILTGIDVVAHEIGHAVCSSTANLVYSYESGAMNEGFSDIWGACVEAMAIDPGNSADSDKNPWLIGEEIGSGVSSYGPLRSMQNPNAEGDPDTYQGTYWNGTSSDNGGVHTNSGVLNYWFYLLANGGSGTNDNGTAYSVTGIGITDAAKIAYRLESVYLSANSQYANARTYGIQSAVDLFGAASQQEMSVTDAWAAVGIGSAYGAGGGGGNCYDDATATAVPYAESFESGSGVWNQASCDDLDWTRDASGTPSSATGPTSGSAGSYYMYVEASSPNYPSKKADLFAAFNLSGSTSPELTFDYHSYGTVADVSLKVEASTDGTNFTQLWSMTGNKGNQWNSVTVDLTSYAGSTVTLRFAATTGNGWQGDVALDNVAIGEAAGGGGGGGTIQDCGSATNVGKSTGQWAYYTWTVPANSQGTTVTTTGANGDADLYVRWGANPTTATYAARSITATSNESVTVTGSGTLHMGVYAYSTFSGLTLQACNTIPTIMVNIDGVEQEIELNGENFDAVGFQVWPNPTSGMLSIATGFDLNTEASAQIMSITGQVAMEVPVADLREGVDVSGLNNGMYIISVEDSKGNVRTQKFIKE